MAKEYKYDWPTIKVEYFEAKEQGITDFLRNKYGTGKNVTTGVFKANTQGWFQEKQAFLRQVQAIAMQRAAQKAAKVYEPNMTELGEMHRATVTLLKASLQKELEECIDPNTGKCIKHPDTKVIESIWKIVKVEKREPTEVGEVIETVTPEENERIKNLIAHVRGHK